MLESTAKYLLDLSYDYAGNGKCTGQLTKLLNNLNHNKDRGYSYDTLGRLVQATGGPTSSPLWTQSYSYDRYGNRLSVSASGYSAKGTQSRSVGTAEQRASLSDKLKFVEPSAPRVDLPTDLLAKNNSVDLPRERGSSPTVREGSESLSDSPSTLRDAGEDARAPSSSTTSQPQSGPPVFTDDPLVPGVTIVKALHITELRDAINQLRVRAGLSTGSWAESVASGVNIKAAHVVEMRNRLEEARVALGLSATSYTDPGLTSGYTIKAAHIQELRDSLKAAWNTSSQIPRDGHASLSYDVASNRITTSGFDYDKAGNQVRALIPGGSGSQRYKYDAANRLVQVLADNGTTVLASYTYGNSNERLIVEEGGLRTYYACDSSVEYTESGSSTVPAWSKSYVYLGGRLLSTLTPNGSGGEGIEYHHPDRLGTRLVTNPTNGSSFEQVGLPFGTPLYAESTGSTNKRFTSYDRSATTGLDYANNRHYDSQQGRFTQVDPISMNSVSLGSPQTLNLYAYCANDPINHTDPSGLGFFSFLGKVFNVIGKILKIVAVIVAVVLIVAAVSLIGTPGMGALVAKALITAGLLLTNAFAPPKVAMAAGILVGIFTMKPPIIVNLLGKGGHNGLLRVLRTIVGISAVNDFLQDQGGERPPVGPLDVIVINHSEPKVIASMQASTNPGYNRGWFGLLWDWVTGSGPRNREFGPNANMTQGLRTSPEIAYHRNQFCKQGGGRYTGGRRFGLNAADGPLRAGTNMPRQYVGSFDILISGAPGGTVEFEATNATGLKSALYHIPGIQDVKPTEMRALSNMNQTYYWLERNPCGIK